MKEVKKIYGRECMVFREGEQPAVLLIQPIGAHERESIDSQMAIIAELVTVPLVMVAFTITTGNGSSHRGKILHSHVLKTWASVPVRRCILWQTS